MGREKETPKKARLQCTFKLPDDREVFGELRLKGKNSRLSLSGSSDFVSLFNGSHLHLYGTTLDHYKITCVNCVPSSQGSTWRGKEATHHFADVFPHFVIVGEEFLNPDAPLVTKIQFSVNDITSLFHDYDAFGHAHNAKSLMGSVLAEKRKQRPIEVGEAPQIVYFTGKAAIITVDTEIGKLVVSNMPSTKMGCPEGVFIKNKIILSLDIDSPITFGDAISRMNTIVRYMTMIAGRTQEINNIHIYTTTSTDPIRNPLRVHWSFSPKCKGAKNTNLKPDFRDIPLDPIQRPEEFKTVLQNWIAREDGWRIARIRYLSGLSKGNSYDTDRLISAANMFEILPFVADPHTGAMSPDLSDAKLECIKILRKLPVSLDRASAISNISRMGKPSLPKKIMARAIFVEKHFGTRLPDLTKLAKIAVQCRNHFVHGSSIDFDIRTIEPFMSFLTDALEFIFAASDLIEAGWEASQWNSRPHSAGHRFARFFWSYDGALSELHDALDCDSKT